MGFFHGDLKLGSFQSGNQVICQTPQSTTAGPAARLTPFGQPPLLDGEDAAAYDELLARICAAVKPVDIIDEMFINDVVSLEWDVLRLRRLKSSLIRARGLELLEEFFSEKLDYNLYSEDFADDLAEILQDNLPEDQAKDARTLARKCAQNEADAVDKVNEVLDGIELDMDKVLDMCGPTRRKSWCKSTRGANRTPLRWSMSFSPRAA